MMKIIEIYETPAALRCRLEHFPFLDLVNVRRAIINPGYFTEYTQRIDFVRVKAEESTTGNEQIIIYIRAKDRACSRVKKSGAVVIEMLRIWEELE